MPNQILSFEEIVNYVDTTSSDLIKDQKPQTLYDPINYFMLKKGKKIRSLLACLSYNLFGGDIKDIKKLLLAIEYLHDFTLIHDDVMDNAPLRRGQIAINKKWSNNQAILSGDALLMSAYNHLLNFQKFNIQLLKYFTHTGLEICEGQQLDLDMQIEKTITLDSYFKMIDLKTGSLIKFSLVAAAKLTKLGSLKIKILENIGSSLGRLFQIQDDYLDLYGLEFKTGKSVGGDVFENKKTFLYLSALDVCEDKKKLIDLYHSNDKNKLSKTQCLYYNLGVKTITENKIKELSSSILELTSKLNLSSDQKALFVDFINMISIRKR